MFLIGDIGNTDLKICLFNKNKKLIKKIKLKSNKVTNISLTKNLNLMLSKKTIFQELV